jgi:hypothetical protein
VAAESKERTEPERRSHDREAEGEWAGEGAPNEPVGDEGRERAAAEQLRKVLARAEPLDEVESDLDKVAARGRGGRRVGHHLLHRPRHQRHAHQRHLRSWALLPAGSLRMRAIGNGRRRGLGLVVCWRGWVGAVKPGDEAGLGWWRAQVSTQQY